MAWYPNTDGLRVVSEFYDNNGKRLKCAYNTSDDSTVLININTLDRLLNGAVIVSANEDMTLEQAEKKYGDEIVKKFLASHGVSDIFTLDEVLAAFGDQLIEKHKEGRSSRAIEASKENQKKAAIASMEKGKFNQAVIIKAVLEGSVKMNIEFNLGYSRATINKALAGLSEEKLNDIWSAYRDTVFENVDRSLVDDFISCNCDYRMYRRYWDSNRVVGSGVAPVTGTEEPVVVETTIEQSDYEPAPCDDSVDEQVPEEDPTDQALSEPLDYDPALGYDKYTSELNRKIIEAGRKPIEAFMSKKPAEESVKEVGIFEQVLEILNKPEVEAPKIERPSPIDSDKYIEMYREREKHPYQRPKVDVSMSNGGNCQVLKSRKGMGLYLESMEF